MSFLSRRCLGLLPLLLGLGCSAPTEIVVVVDAQPETRARLGGLTLSIDGWPDPIAIEASALPATLGVQGREGSSGLEAVVRAALAGGGELEARGQLEFVSSSRQMLYLELDDSCVDECEDGSCFRGGCRPAARVAPCPFVRSVADQGQAVAELSHGCFEGVDPDAGPLDAEPRDAGPLDGSLDASPDAGCGSDCDGWSHLALGPRHACGVRGGAAFCWGSNAHGEIGDDSFSPASLPSAVVGIDGPVRLVEVGDRHSCALTETGAVYCWGAGGLRQLGSETPQESTATLVSAVSRCSALALGPDFSCAICDDSSTVTCWGARHGLAVSTQDPMVPTPTVVSDVDGITAGAAHVCAWSAADRSVRCWGDAPAAVLGHGAAAPSAPTGLASVRSVAAGREHTCALLTDDSVTCWGHSPLGQAGLVAAVVMPTETVQVTVGGFVALSAGADHTCGVSGVGSLLCWGANTHGHLVEGAEASLTPRSIRQDTGWTDVSVGTLATCGIDADGERDCFGYNPTGVVSSRSLVYVRPQVLPVQMSDVTLGGRHGCGQLVDDSMRLTCWGAGDMGQRGDGSFVSSSGAPTNTGGPPGVVAVPSLGRAVAGPAQTCAIETDMAEVFCWGDGSTAVVVPANPSGGLVPQPRDTGLFDGATGPLQLALGGRHACALTEAGFQCWGFDDEGQLGTEATTLPDAAHTDIAAGRAHSCLLTSSGFAEIWCWGSNSHGQSQPLDASAEPVRGPLPVNLGPLLRAAALDLAVGDDFSCVTDGAGVICWGSNSDGQLGNPDDSETVQTVPGLPMGLLGVTAGAAHACAWTTDAAYCWGRNHSGQLARGQVSPSERAEVIAHGIVDHQIERLTAGPASTCAETTGGTYCWGSDEDWRLGLHGEVVVR